MQPTMLTLPESGLRLAVYEAGNPSGNPIFFLHGNSLAADTFGQQLAAPELQQFRLVALDLPGHGQSPAAPACYAVSAMRAVVLAALQRLGLEQALLVGHSYGGNLLLELLPDLPHAQGLMAIAAPPVGTPAAIPAAFQLNETGQLFYTQELTTEQVEELARYCLRPEATVAEVGLVAADIRRTDGRARPALAASFGDIRDEVAFVAATSVPLALVAGELDAAIRFSYFAALVTPSRWEAALHVLPGVGHTPFLESPAAFNQLLLRFEAATVARHC